MTTQSVGFDGRPFENHLNVQKMPAHWLMAHLGKRVLRPGGGRRRAGCSTARASTRPTT